MARCLICTHEKVDEINALLLQRNGRRTGAVTQLAEKLQISRQVLWRHRRFHLRLNISRQKPLAGMTLEERAAALGEEGNRLQCQIEHGAPNDVADRALKALSLRMKALALEAQLSGRLAGGRPGERSLALAMGEGGVSSALEDPEALEKARREFIEVCGPEAEAELNA